MDLPDFLTQNSDGEIRITGHRIGLYHLVQGYNEGESAESLASRYPTLPLSLVHKTIAFYLDNQRDVDVYVAACTASLGDQRTTGPQLNLSDLRERLAKGQRPEAASEPQIR